VDATAGVVVKDAERRITEVNIFHPTFVKLIITFVGILIVGFLFQFFQRYLGREIKDVETSYRARRFINSLGYVAYILVIVTVFGAELSGLTVALGVAGAGVAFALQEIIASVAGWAAISFGHFYQTGDRIQLGGIMGDVIDIGILRTTMMECGQWVSADLYNGRIVRVANSFVFKEPVFNYSADFAFLWDEITVPVKYGGDYRLAREILYRVADEVVGDYTAKASVEWKRVVKRYMVEDASTKPTVTLIANDNWMEFTLRHVVDYKKRRSTKDRLFTRILEEFEQTEGRVAIASMTVHIVETPVFDVRLGEQRRKQPDPHR
jgi:small-conductance mechanosensitive channel